MAVGNITVTADLGPGRSVAGIVFNNVRSLVYDFPGDRLIITLTDGRTRYFNYSNIATVTHTISSGVATVTISK
jgi:hypothetical protein